MAVLETYAIEVDGPADGLAIAERLAASQGLACAWAALWTADRARADGVAAGGGGITVVGAEGQLTVCARRPSPAEVRHLLDRAASEPVCVHWSRVPCASEDGPGSWWLAFVDPSGTRREDARVYTMELAGHAVPLTTHADDPTFGFGPEPAAGWALRVSVVRDHMPRETLRRRLAEAAGVGVGAVG